MFSPFGRVVHRILINEQNRVTQQGAETVEASQRRTTALMQEHSEDVWEKSIAPIRENRELKATHDRALGLIRMLADRSEAFQRIAVHLRASWPAPPAESGPVPVSVDQREPQFMATLAVVTEDEAWKTRREARIQSVLNPVKRTDPQR